jgi:Neuraminidase (sialidase)
VLAFDEWHTVTLTGTAYTLGRTNQDYGTPLIRQATSNTLQNDGKRFVLSRLEMQGRAGRSDLGRPAQVMLEMSKDFGETWSDPKVRSLGDVGEYSQRLVWRKLGQYKQATARISWADMAEVPVDNIAMLDIT